jgi:hypothetical protein
MQAYRLIQYASPYIDRQLLGVAGVCFIAPIIHTNLFVWFGLMVYRLMGYEPVRITHWTLLGCFPERWMQAVSYFAFLAFSIALASLGFVLSRKGYREKNLTWLLAGAFFLYPIANRLRGFIVTRIQDRGALWFVEQKAFFESRMMPVFGNLYNFRLAQFCINTVMSIALYALAYWVVTRYWDLRFRWQMLTVGALACVGGWFFWHLFLGRLLY